jgi:hypothetical protein
LLNPQLSIRPIILVYLVSSLVVILPLVAACSAIVLVHQVALVKEFLSEALLNVKQVSEAALQDVCLRLREDGHIIA